MGQLPNPLSDSPKARSYRFGPFLVDTRSGELRRSGLRIRLQEQPFQILVAMLERPGELVPREELQKRLWPTDTFVDFENSLNSAVNRLRDALGDSAENPQYVETLPRRGYRFIAPVESAEPAPTPAPQTRPAGLAPGPIPPRRTAAWIGVAIAIVLLAGASYAWLRSPAPPIPTGKIMLAILPFDDLTGSADHQYFVEGLADELILQLGKLRPQRLGVIARTSIMQYKGTRKSIEQIGRELGVQYVLTGTIRPARAVAASGQAPLLISTQLVQVRDQSSLWSESYQHTLHDFFEVQTDVAVRVTGSLASELLPDLQNALARTPRINPEAQAAYLKGRFYWNQRSQAGGTSTLQALVHFEEAVRIEPHYAAAHAALAGAQLSLATGGFRELDEVVPIARTANSRALAIDPHLAEAYLNLARISFYYDHDWKGAENLFQRALALDPNSTDAYFYYSVLLGALKRYPEAKERLLRAREIDPMAPSSWLLGSLLAERMGDQAAALAMSKRHGELLGNPTVESFVSGLIYAWNGQCAEALALLKKAEDAGAVQNRYASEHAIILSRCGDQAGAEKARAKAMQLPFMNSFHRGLVEAALGNVPQACKLLEEGLAKKEASLPLLNIEPRFDAIRGQPCFQKVIKRLGLEP